MKHSSCGSKTLLLTQKGLWILPNNIEKKFLVRVYGAIRTSVITLHFTFRIEYFLLGIG